MMGLLEIYFQNSQVLLVLTSQNLPEDIWRLEGAIAQGKAARRL